MTEPKKKFEIWDENAIEEIFYFFSLVYGNEWNARFKSSNLFRHSIIEEDNYKNIKKIWEHALKGNTPLIHEITEEDLKEFLLFASEEFETVPHPVAFCNYFTILYCDDFFDSQNEVIIENN